jgi:hypothetical protein
MRLLLRHLIYVWRVTAELLRHGLGSGIGNRHPGGPGLWLLPLLLSLQPAGHDLTLRLRYPDGGPVVGLAVTLLKLPDHMPVGWQNADNACYTNERGECNWQVSSGLYEFAFPEGYQPDPVTLAELGEGGLHSLAVFLDRDASIGIVLADPHTRTAGETLFFDRAPDEPLPQFVVPDASDSHQHGGQPGPEPTPVQSEATGGLGHPEETPVVTPVITGVTGPRTFEREWLSPFWFVLAAAIIAGTGFVVYQQWQIRRRESLMRQRIQLYTARRVED